MINEKEKTLDSNFSFGPRRMEELISESVEVWKSLGSIKKDISKDENFIKI